MATDLEVHGLPKVRHAKHGACDNTEGAGRHHWESLIEAALTEVANTAEESEWA